MPPIARWKTIRRTIQRGGLTQIRKARNGLDRLVRFPRFGSIIERMVDDEAISPNIAITYCRLCGWLLRASWMAQELLTTFAEELGSVTLIPDNTGGMFEVRLDGKLLWSRAEHGRFPDIKELKQLVRDEVAPERELGHSDAKPAQT